MSKKKGIREIEFGSHSGDMGSKTCIYDNGHLDKAKFVTDVELDAPRLDTPLDSLIHFISADVQHLWFRPMSPSEARDWGCNSGVMQCEEGQGYPVTAIIF